MADRKWKEGKQGKQQPSMLLGSAVPGSSLVSFYFLWGILCPHVVRFLLALFTLRLLHNVFIDYPQVLAVSDECSRCHSPSTSFFRPLFLAVSENNMEVLISPLRPVLPTGDFYRQIWSKLAKFNPPWQF